MVWTSDTYTNSIMKGVFLKHKIYMNDIFLKHKNYIVSYVVKTVENSSTCMHGMDMRDVQHIHIQ